MNIWWCQNHESSGFVTGPSGMCWRQRYGGGNDVRPCRMVEMELVPFEPIMTVKEWLDSIANREPS